LNDFTIAVTTDHEDILCNTVENMKSQLILFPIDTLFECYWIVEIVIYSFGKGITKTNNKTVMAMIEYQSNKSTLCHFLMSLAKILQLEDINLHGIKNGFAALISTDEHLLAIVRPPKCRNLFLLSKTSNYSDVIIEQLIPVLKFPWVNTINPKDYYSTLVINSMNSVDRKVDDFLREKESQSWTNAQKSVLSTLNLIHFGIATNNTYNEATRRLIIDAFVLSAISFVQGTISLEEDVPKGENFVGNGPLDYRLRGKMVVTKIRNYIATTDDNDDIDNSETIAARAGIGAAAACTYAPILDLMDGVEIGRGLPSSVILEAKVDIATKGLAQYLAQLHDELIASCEIPSSNKRARNPRNRVYGTLSSGHHYDFLGLKPAAFEGGLPEVEYYGSLKCHVLTGRRCQMGIDGKYSSVDEAEVTKVLAALIITMTVGWVE
jgi:hypothetical protein